LYTTFEQLQISKVISVNYTQNRASSFFGCQCDNILQTIIMN